MIAWRPTSLSAMFCAECLAAQAMGDGGKAALGVARQPTARPACRPWSRRRRRRVARCPDGSSSMAWALTMSRMVMTGKSRPQGRPVAGLISFGPLVPMQPAERVAADHEVTVGIERLAGSHHQLPPAGFAGDRVGTHDELIAGERVTQENRVGALLVERAVGLIGEREGPQGDTAIELERRLPAELDAQAGLCMLRRGLALGHCGHRSPGLRAAASPHRIAGRKCRRKGVRQLRFEPESQCSL